MSEQNIPRAADAGMGTSASPAAGARAAAGAGGNAGQRLGAAASATGHGAAGEMLNAVSGEGMTTGERLNAGAGAAAELGAGAAVTAATGSAAAGKAAGKVAGKTVKSKTGKVMILSMVLAPFLVSATVLVIIASVVFSMMSAFTEEDDDPSANGINTNGALIGVPEEYKAVIMRAGSICPEVTPGIIAAQLQAESNFNPTATSPVGASGIAQFMPATWAGAGKDGDGDGVADILNPIDAIWSQGNYMCAKVSEVRAMKIGSNIIELALAAYNAGSGNVQKYGGIPPFLETQNYVRKIMASAATFWDSSSSTTVISGTGKAVDALNYALKNWKGKEYLWGQIVPGVGTDCSGLVQSSFASVGISLPRVAADQQAAVQKISALQAKPGDLVFWADGRGVYHVAIYMGNNQIIEAAKPGVGIRVTQIWGTPAYWGRVKGS